MKDGGQGSHILLRRRLKQEWRRERGSDAEDDGQTRRLGFLGCSGSEVASPWLASAASHHQQQQLIQKEEVLEMSGYICVSLVSILEGTLEKEGHWMRRRCPFRVIDQQPPPRMAPLTLARLKGYIRRSQAHSDHPSHYRSPSTEADC